MIFRYQSPSPWRWLGPSCLCQFSLSTWCLKSWGKGRNQKPSLESCPHGSLQNVIVWEIFWVSLKNTPFIGATAILSVAHYHTIPLLVACICLTIIYFYFLLGIPMFSGHDPQISHFFDGFISMFLPTYIYIYIQTHGGQMYRYIDIYIFTYNYLYIHVMYIYIRIYIYTHSSKYTSKNPAPFPPRWSPRCHHWPVPFRWWPPDLSTTTSWVSLLRPPVVFKKEGFAKWCFLVTGGLAIHIYEYKYNI